MSLWVIYLLSDWAHRLLQHGHDEDDSLSVLPRPPPTPTMQQLLYERHAGLPGLPRWAQPSLEPLHWSVLLHLTQINWPYPIFRHLPRFLYMVLYLSTALVVSGSKVVQE